MIGAEFDGDITFEETGDNTDVFESVDVFLGDLIVVDVGNESVILTLNDRADYADVDSADNTSTETDEETFTVDDVDGDFEDVGSVTFGSELKLTLIDVDRNIDSQDDDSLDDCEVFVFVDAADDLGDTECVPMEETEDNSGTFTIDLSNGELRITFLGEGEDSTEDNGILELRNNASNNDITEDIVVEYEDPADDASEVSVVASFTLGIDLTDGTVDLPDSAGVNDDFTLTITDPDLNNNPRARDSYTFELAGAGEFDLTRGGASIGDSATLEVDISTEDVTFFDDALTYTLLETGINTGVFEVDLDMRDILDSTGADVEDGDEIEITYNDLMGDTTREDSDTISIVSADTGVDFSRTVLPIPPEAGSVTAALVGDTVFVTLTVTDSDENTDSALENTLATNDTVDFVFEDDATDFDGPSFRFEFDDGLEGTVSSEDEYDAAGGCEELDDDGTCLEDILPELPVLGETGKSTGVFEDTLEFVNGGVDPDVWQDTKLTVVYIDRTGDEESAGVTFRGNDGVVSVDQNSARTGTLVTITVQDEDLNLDDDEVEEFEASAAEFDDDADLLSVETEDDTVEDDDGVSEETFRETGPDTGIFTAEYEVGGDIPVTSADGSEQASNILITYNDEIDSTGDEGEDLEVNIPVVTATGAIQITPELVGPGTTLTVLVTDADLDLDGGSTDDYDEADELVTFTTNRDATGDAEDEASPDLDETGPNTGVFEFEIELVTDGEACADDLDLGDADFADSGAEGGSEPSIGACPGDIISIEYEDEQDANGNSRTVSAMVEVRSWDPEFVADKDSYAIGDRAVISINDPDANQDPDVADSLTEIDVTSDSDIIGETFSAIETGKDTGVFTVSFLLTGETQSGAITVETGDTVTIEYTDEFPADFEEAEEDKEFTFTIEIGGPADQDTTTPSAPSLKDVSGEDITEVTVGQQVVLSTTIQNNANEEVPFVALVEVRDSDGITIFLAWQTGTLNANSDADIGLSWTPEEAGDYTVRTFVISDLASPEILSPVAESEITVS
jgi:hypothetical protein